MNELSYELKQVEADRENIRQQQDTKKLELERIKTTYEHLLESVPKEVREPGELVRQLKEAEATKEKLHQAWDEAQKNLNQARETIAKASTHEQNATYYLEESQTKLKNAEQTFNQALEQSGFTNETDYRNAKRTEEERKAMKDRIESFKQQQATVQSRISELRDWLSEKERVDIEGFENKVNEAQKGYELALQQYNATVQYQQDVVSLKERVIEAGKQVDEQEKRLIEFKIYTMSLEAK